VIVPTALMSVILFNPWRPDQNASTTPDPIPTLAPATEAPAGRSAKPNRQAARIPASAPQPLDTITPTSSVLPTSTILPTTEPTVVVYPNCAAVRAAGKAPLPRGNPGYSRTLDRNHDGIACASGD